MRDPPVSRAVLVVVVAALFVTPAAAMALPGQSLQSAAQTTESPPANESVQPGARMAGVVGVQAAEIDGSVEGRAYGQAIATANSNRSKAAVVADTVAKLETRLDDLQQRREALQAAVENGRIDRDTYQAQMASVAVRIQQVERQLNRSQSVAGALPAQVRNAAGLNVSAIETLRGQAGQMRGGEVSEIARTIAGRNAGNGIPDVPRGGPPEGVPGNWTRGPGQGGPGQGPGNGGPGNGGPGQGNGQAGDHPGKSGERGPDERRGGRTTTAVP